MISMGLLNKLAKKRNTYNENVAFLRNHGIGIKNQQNFKKFMKSRNMSFWKDIITQELIQEYLKQKRRKEEISNNENVAFLRNYGIGIENQQNFKKL